MARGDQIYVEREFLNLQGVYEHHGIDCGDGTVIHYRKGTDTIERNNIEVFSDGRRIYTRHYPTSFTPDVVVRRAMSRLGEQKYNLLFNNCEHFATWCKTGVSYSKQVNDFLPIIRAIDPQQLAEPVREALRLGPPDLGTSLLDQALAQIKTTWNQIQPQYNHAIQESRSWEEVAKQALRRDREDLARAALQKKQTYHKQAKDYESQLQKLAELTQTLLENQRLTQRESSN